MSVWASGSPYAGFRDVAVQTLVETARFASPDELLAAQLAATPLSALGEITDGARAGLVRDVRAALAAYVDEQCLAVPMEAHIVVARA